MAKGAMRSTYKPRWFCRASCPMADHHYCGGCTQSLGHGDAHRGCEWSGGRLVWKDKTTTLIHPALCPQCGSTRVDVGALGARACRDCDWLLDMTVVEDANQ